MHTAELYNDLNDFTNKFSVKKAEATLREPLQEKPYLEAAMLTLRQALAQIKLLHHQEVLHRHLSKEVAK